MGRKLSKSWIRAVTVVGVVSPTFCLVLVNLLILSSVPNWYCVSKAGRSADNIPPRVTLLKVRLGQHTRFDLTLAQLG